MPPFPPGFVGGGPALSGGECPPFWVLVAHRRTTSHTTCAFRRHRRAFVAVSERKGSDPVEDVVRSSDMRSTCVVGGAERTMRTVGGRRNGRGTTAWTWRNTKRCAKVRFAWRAMREGSQGRKRGWTWKEEALTCDAVTYPTGGGGTTPRGRCNLPSEVHEREKVRARKR